MAQDIIVKYKSEVDQFQAEMNAVADTQERIGQEAKKSQKQVDQSTQAQESATKKRLTALKAEEAELKRLTTLRKQAFDPKIIADFDRKIAAVNNNIQLLGGKTKSALSGVGSQIATIGASIAATMGVAFSVDAAIRFGQASIQAFLEAESSANRLKFAITQVGNESDQVFERLLQQSERLQKRGGIFSDEAIQSSQTALANFGLLGVQIEELIPKILDLAAANEIRLEQATEAVIRGLEGQTRGLTLLGLKFQDTGSIIGNYGEILEKTTKFTGGLEDASRTLEGQLATLDNRANELQEDLGERLAPAWVKLKNAIFEATLSLLNYGSTRDEVFSSSEDVGVGAAEKLIAKLKEQGRTTEEISAILQNNIKLRQDELRHTIAELNVRTKAQDLTRAEGQVLEAKIKLIESIINTYAGEISRLQEIKEANDLVLKQSDLRLLSEKELIELRKKNEADGRAFARDNVDAINKEIEERKKANEKLLEEQKKAAEKLAAENEKIFEDFKKQLDAEQDALLRSIDRTAQELKDKAALLEFKVRLTAQVEGEDAALIQARDALFKEFQEENIRAEKATSDTVEEVNAQKQRNYEQYISNLTKLVGDFKMFEFETYDESTKRLQEELELRDQEYSEFLGRVQTLTFAVIDSIERISGSFTSRELQRIEDRKNAELSALDVQQQAIADSLETRRISESEASKLSRDLLEKRIQAEKKALEEERKAKKKQAILDKAAALIKIAISTAVNSIEQPGPFGALIPYWVALGALEAGVVAAEPIPYKKGSKDTGKKGHMARVGEEGEEIVYMPSHSKVLPARQTKTYGEALDAMMDNRFEKYVMKKYVAPALLGQQKNYAEKKDKQFARNITESMIIQATGLTPSEYRKIHKEGFNLNNPEAVAQALAPLLRDNPYLRR